MRIAGRIFVSLLLAGLVFAGPAQAKILVRSVTFKVENVNRSVLHCSSDGSTYEVKGHLIGPAGSGRSGAVTLYLHGLSFGEFFWNFTAVPRYDYAAAMARAGHASVVIDRLGYGASGRPEGNETCLGADADVAHQIVGKLRSGDYAAQGGAPRFDEVAIAGHSIGALIANIEAISFSDVDALVAIGYTPQVSRDAFEQFYESRAVCDRGGQPAAPGGPGAYAYFQATPAEFEASSFATAVPAVRAAADALRAPDPCGDGASIIDGLVQDLKLLSRVNVPVLVVCGRDDATTPSFACPVLKRRYSGSRDASLYYVPHAGHALPLERSAPTFRRHVGAWLQAHGF
jgi:pimeloyl-ACP methyl ester carboxylesterase